MTGVDEGVSTMTLSEQNIATKITGVDPHPRVRKEANPNEGPKGVGTSSGVWEVCCVMGLYIL